MTIFNFNRYLKNKFRYLPNNGSVARILKQIPFVYLGLWERAKVHFVIPVAIFKALHPIGQVGIICCILCILKGIERPTVHAVFMGYFPSPHIVRTVFLGIKFDGTFSSNQCPKRFLSVK